jgi:hypothetical protein
MRWHAFAEAAPELALLAREAFEDQHLCIIATLRANGWPRVSPNEVYLVDNDLLLGMMPGSLKARDLERDPRITVVNGQSQRIPARGDVKLYGRAVGVDEAGLRERFADTQEATIGWRPSEPFHLFAVDIESAGFISFGEARQMLRWSPGRGTERLAHPEDGPGG